MRQSISVRRHSRLGSLLGFLIFVFLLALPISSLASLQSREDFVASEYDEASKLHLGFLFGAGILGDDGGSHLGYGFEAGYRFSPYWSAGPFFEQVNRGQVSSQEAGGTTAVDARMRFYGAQLNYFVDAIPGFQAGAKLALGENSIDTSAGSNTSSDLYAGPRILYDHPIGGGVTVGGEGHILWGFDSESRTASQLLASIKLWL